MKIGSVVGGLLSLLLFACGGGEPKKSAPSGSASSSGDSQTPENKAAGGTTPEAGNAAKGDSANETSGSTEAKQDPKPKRIRRPRVNYNLVKALLGNDPPSPRPRLRRRLN